MPSPATGKALQAAFRELAISDQKEKRIAPLSELNLETPEDDAIEQNTELVPDEPGTALPHEAGSRSTRRTPPSRSARSATTMTTIAETGLG